jgi:MOSC domain-containing protein
MPLDAARVLFLRRFPVKSMTGERRDHLDVDLRGCVGDRVWSVRTVAGKIGSGKNTRRFEAVPGLLEIRAREVEGRVVITFPDGTTCPIDAAQADMLLSRHLGRPVTVAREDSVSHFDDGPVSLVGSASVDAVAAERGEEVDAARFRSNVVLTTDEPFLEDTWVGRRLGIGTAILLVTLASPRCVMVDMETADLPTQHGNLTAVGRVNGANLGVIATVDSPGRIERGDAVRLL